MAGMARSPPVSWKAVAGILGALPLHQIWNTVRQTEVISCSELEQLVATKKISEVVVDSDTIEGTAKEPAADGKSKVVLSGSIRRSRISLPTKGSR